MDPITGAAVAGSVMSFKGQRAAAKSARQAAEYNAQVAENEAVLLARQKAAQQESLRMQSRQLIGSQRVATAASGIQMSGNPLDAMAAAYFGVEKDVADLEYASNIEQLNKASEAAMTRAEGRANASAMQVQAYASLLGGASSAYSGYKTSQMNTEMYNLQKQSLRNSQG